MEKKQQSSVFQVFILKNKLKKTEIAQYLGVSNAFNERYSNYKNYLHRMNRNLKEFGYTRVGKRGKKDKEGAFPFLSTYYTRHTWATLAAYLEIPKETIAAALGHGKKDVTDIYIFFDQNKIDEANRRVIDYLNKN